MATTRKRIAINAAGFSGWGGGIDFVRILLNALASFSCKNFEYFIFIHVDAPAATHYCCKIGKIIKKILNVAPAKKQENINKHVDVLLSSFENIDGNFNIIFYHERELEYFLKKLKIDLLFPIPPSRNRVLLPIKQIGYLYDFQHEYYPQFFSTNEIEKRREDFEFILKNINVIIVNAQAVADDIKKFYPSCPSTIVSLPFAAAPVALWGEPYDVNVLRQTYNLPQTFFMMSNQFWQHKSHITAFQGLKLLDRDDVHIVCTGSTSDYRAPDYFGQLYDEIKRLNIGNRIHFLGHIPKLDQIHIMKNAVAILQPTLFEGGPGGGSVYDAVALGIPSIVSNIAVNREIDADTVVFFNVGDAKDMAIKMDAVLHGNCLRKSSQEAAANGMQRTKELHDVLINALVAALR